MTSKRVWSFLRKYVLAPLPILLLFIGAVVLVVLGVKNVQVGGLIGRLLGRKEGSRSAIDVANSIPEDRVDERGTLIPMGAPDGRGVTQARVVPIQKPGLFDDPDKVKVTDPDSGDTVDVDLPTGVKAKDVDQVVIVTPEVTAVTVKSDSKVSAEDVDTLLDKYAL